MWLHGIAGTILLCSTFVFSYVPVFYYGKALELEKTHRVVGFACATLALFLYLGGLTVKLLKEKFGEYHSQKVLLVAKCHKFFAYVLILVAHYNMYKGVKPHRKWMFWILVVVLITALAFLEYRQRQKAKGHDPLTLTENLDIISIELFNRSVWREGKDWVILDDLVLDVSEYASRHPGGAFFLKHSRGKDISKYFYGGY